MSQRSGREEAIYGRGSMRHCVLPRVNVAFPPGGSAEGAEFEAALAGTAGALSAPRTTRRWLRPRPADSDQAGAATRGVHVHRVVGVEGQTAGASTIVVQSRLAEGVTVRRQPRRM